MCGGRRRVGVIDLVYNNLRKLKFDDDGTTTFKDVDEFLAC